MPGEMQTVNLTIQPQKSPRSRAGEYTLTVKACQPGCAQGICSDQGHPESWALFLSSRATCTRRSCAASQYARITVQNQGNRPETYKLTCRDRGDELVFKALTPQLQVPGGADRYG